MAASVGANRDQALGSIARGEHIGTATRVAARAQRRRRNGMTLRSKVLVALAGAALVVGARSTGTPTRSGAPGGGPDGALVKRSDIKIEIVTHGQAQDGFWGVVRNGVKAGAPQMGVTANSSAPGAESDMPGMVSLIDAAVAKKPTGLVVSIPNPDALGPAIKKGVDARDPGASRRSRCSVYT